MKSYTTNIDESIVVDMKEDEEDGIVLDQQILDKLNGMLQPLFPSSKGAFFAREFLKISEYDLRDSKILFKQKSYANSVFLFQQSVEKAIKSLLYATNILENERDAYDRKIQIGHDSVSAFIKFRNKIIPIGEEMIRSGLIQGFDESELGNPIELLIEEYGGARVDAFRLTNLCVVSLFLHYMIQGHAPEEIKKTVLRVFQEPSLIEEIPDGKMYADLFRMSGLSNPNPSMAEAIEKYYDAMLDIASQSQKWFQSTSSVTAMALLISAVVTNPHEKTTRYPNSASEKLNPDKYDINLGIVQNLPSLFVLHQLSINYLRDYLIGIGILKQEMASK